MLEVEAAEKAYQRANARAKKALFRAEMAYLKARRAAEEAYQKVKAGEKHESSHKDS